MALGSGIEWTESTWNPVTGCDKISPGRKYCYAERMAERLQAMGQPNDKDGFRLTLLGPLPKLNLNGIDWVIVGGESGPGARPMARDWATDIRDQCAKAGIAFFFEQWGGKNKKKAGRVLEGKTYDAMPERAPTVLVGRVSRGARRFLAVVG